MNLWKMVMREMGAMYDPGVPCLLSFSVCDQDWIFFFSFFLFFAEVVVFVFSLWGRGEKDLIRVGTPKAGNLADSFGFQHLNAWRKICITRNQSPWTYAKELAVRQEHV